MINILTIPQHYQFNQTNNMKKDHVIFLLIIMFYLNSCAPIMSPAIEVKNTSADGSIIKNVKMIWNGYHLIKIPRPVDSCGGALEQNFNIRNESDFFGPVHVEWENASGQKLIKDFNFAKKDFPTFSRSMFGRHVYHYVVLYLTQTDLEYYTSDNPNIKKIRKEKSGDWIIIGGECVKDAKTKWGTPNHNYCVNKKGDKIECK